MLLFFTLPFDCNLWLTVFYFTFASHSNFFPGMLFSCLLEMWFLLARCVYAGAGHSGHTALQSILEGLFQGSLPCSIRRGRLYVAFTGTAQKRHFLRLLEMEQWRVWVKHIRNRNSSMRKYGYSDIHCEITSSIKLLNMNYSIHHISSTFVYVVQSYDACSKLVWLKLVFWLYNVLNTEIS